MGPSLQAWHEAGHAVIAHLLGGHVLQVSLETELDDHEGNTTVSWQDALAHPDQLSAMVAMAGPLAELHQLGQEVDPQDAELASSWRGDQLEFQASLERWMPDDPAEREQRGQALITRVQTMLEDPRTWMVVGRVADALEAHGELDEVLFSEAAGPVG